MSHAIHSYFKFVHPSIQLKDFHFRSTLLAYENHFCSSHTVIHSNMNKYGAFMKKKLLRNPGNIIIVIVGVIIIRFGATYFSRKASNQTMFQHILPPRIIHSVHLFSFFHSNRCELLDARHFASHHMFVILFIFSLKSQISHSLSLMCVVYNLLSCDATIHMCICITCVFFGDAR